MGNFIINGHPAPFVNESFRGYLLRIVDLNGFKGIRIFKRKFNFFNFNYNHFCDDMFVKELINLLAPALFTEPAKLERYFNSHWVWNIYQSNREYLQGLFNQHCRLCPLCIKENGYYESNWDFSLTTFCHKHNCYLIDKCPSCKKQITWQGGSLDKCHDCDEVYSDSPVELIPNDSPLYELAKLINKHRQHTIEKIVVVCSRVHRLGDNMLASLHLHKMPLSEVIPLLTRVSYFLCSERYREEYIDWLNATRQEFQCISEKAVLEPYFALKDIFPCHSLKNTLDVPFTPPDDIDKIKKSEIDRATKVAEYYGVSPARLNNSQPDIEEINLKLQIESERLSLLLNIPYESIETLVQLGTLKPSNNIARLHCYFFYLSEIAELLTPASNPPLLSSKYMTLDEFTSCEKFKAFALPKYAAIELVIRKEIPLHCNTQANGFMNQFIDEKTAFTALHNEMLKESNNRTTDDLAAIFHTSVENIIGLYEQGYIDIDNFWKASGSTAQLVNSDSFESIVNKYTSINRLCYFSGSHVGDEKRALKQQGISPAITINESCRKLYLYSSSVVPQEY